MKKYKRNSINLQQKRIAIFVIAIILVQALCPVIGEFNLVPVNHAINLIYDDYIEYEIKDSIAIANKCITSESKYLNNIEIKNKIKVENNTYIVREIGVYGFNGSSVVNVTIPDNVNKINMGAFGNCHSLKKIIIPYSVKSIDESAFEGANKDLVIYCYENTYAETWAKSHNKNYIVIPQYSKCDNIEYELTYKFNTPTALVYDYYGKNTNVEIPESIQVNGIKYTVNLIGNAAFAEKNITSVWLPSSIEDIYTFAFDECNNLKNIYLYEGTNIGDQESNVWDDKNVNKNKYNNSTKDKLYQQFKNGTSGNNNNQTSTTSQSDSNTSSKITNNNTTTETIITTTTTTTTYYPPEIEIVKNELTKDRLYVEWKVKSGEVSKWKVTTSKDSSVGNWNNENVGSGSFSQIENGTYYLHVQNTYGAWAWVSFDTKNFISPESPKIELKYETKQYITETNNKIKITFKATDNVGVTGYKISRKTNDWNNVNGYTSFNGTIQKEFTVEKKEDVGTYYFYVRDAAGNASWKSFDIIKDTTKPSFTISPTLENGKINFVAWDGGSGIWCYKITNNASGIGGAWKYFDEQNKKALIDVRKSITADLPSSTSSDFYVVMQDAAGNQQISNKITINKPTVKTITETSNDGSIVDGKYYLKNGSKLTLKATFSEAIKEINKEKIQLNGSSKVNINVTLNNDKKGCTITIEGTNTAGNGKIIFNKGFLVNNDGTESDKARAIISAKTSGEASKNKGQELEIYIDNTAPTVSMTYKTEGVTATIKDENLITEYQWKALNDDGKIIYTGKIIKPNKKEISPKLTFDLTNSSLNGKTVQITVKDAAGNSKTYSANPPIESKVEFVKRNSNIVTYRITTNLKANLGNYSLDYINSNQKTAKNCKITKLERESGDTTGKKFILEIDTNGIQNNEEIIIPKGQIYIYSQSDSRESQITVNVDNTKPTVKMVETVLEEEKKGVYFIFNDDIGIKTYKIQKASSSWTNTKIKQDVKEYKTGTIEIKKSGDFNVTVIDNQGNTTTKKFSIDITAPKATITYGAPNEKGEVEVTIKANKKISSLEYSEASVWENFDDTTIKRTYKENELTGTGVKDTVTIVDEAGNKKILELGDNIAPRLLNMTSTLLANGSTKVEIKFSEKIKEKDGWTLSEDATKLTKNITEDEELIVEDLAGNKSEIIEANIKTSETTYQKLIKSTQTTPKNSNTLTTVVTKVINLNRPIQDIDLGSLKSKVDCQLNNTKDIVTLTFKQNTPIATIKFIEDIQKPNVTVQLTIPAISNIVIKGDSNLDGVISGEDIRLLRRNMMNLDNETDKKKLFAMDMNGDGKISSEDWSGWMAMRHQFGEEDKDEDGNMINMTGWIKEYNEYINNPSKYVSDVKERVGTL